jgi:hypothetical protein
VRIRATARLGGEDLHLDTWPPRTALPRSVVDLAEWSASHDEARMILALAVASGIVESDEVRSALARRGPISRRQVIGDALDDLDADAPWVPDLLYQRVEDRFGLPPGRRARPDARAPGRLEIGYEPWQVHVELGMISATGIRTAAVPPAPVTALGSRGGRVARSAPAGIQMITHAGRASRHAGQLLLRVPIRILREEPDRVGAAVVSALRQRGWTGAPSRLARGGGVRVPGFAAALTPALDQAFGPALGLDPTSAGFGALGDHAVVQRTWA